MTADNEATLKVGTRVKLRDSGFDIGRIVEYRGPLGPKGMRIYRVRIPQKPKSIYLELREDQLEPVRTEQAASD